MLTMMWLSMIWMTGCGTSSVGPSDRRTFPFDFASGTQGWVPGFADYPPEYGPQMELVAEYRRLPAPLDQTRGGLFISGLNHSDNLFMFWKRRVDGLQNDRTYLVEFTLEFATSVPKGAGGPGRPDGSVWVKVGASSVEPVPVLSAEGRYHLNIDKGNQAQSGKEAVVIGTVGNLSGTETWELKELESGASPPLTVTPNPDGSVWLLVGTDSGFEGRTSLYYTRLSAQLTPR
jgi:hypothetical protein